MRPDADERINPGWTVGEVEKEFEGKPFLNDVEGAKFLCDFCSKGVSYSRRKTVTGYIADDILNPDHPKWPRGQRPLVPLATYCPECSTHRLLFPCEGFAEIRYRFTVDDDGIFRDVEVTDISPRDDGIPYDATEVSEQITGVPWEHQSLVSMVARGDMWGPENFITFFLSSVDGIDPRNLIRWDGSVDPQQLGLARRKYENFAEKMQRGGYSRTKFRDHVRGGE